MNDIPLTDASFSEVLARVAYRYIWRQYFFGVYHDTDPIAFLRFCEMRAQRAGFEAIAAWICAYRYAAFHGELTRFARTQFIFRARLGLDYRSVMTAGYKANRRRDPRVTNRGVTESPTGKGES